LIDRFVSGAGKKTGVGNRKLYDDNKIPSLWSKQAAVSSK